MWRPRHRAADVRRSALRRPQCAPHFCGARCPREAPEAGQPGWSLVSSPPQLSCPAQSKIGARAHTILTYIPLCESDRAAGGEAPEPGSSGSLEAASSSFTASPVVSRARPWVTVRFRHSVRAQGGACARLLYTHSIHSPASRRAAAAAAAAVLLLVIGSDASLGLGSARLQLQRAVQLWL